MKVRKTWLGTLYSWDKDDPKGEFTEIWDKLFPITCSCCGNTPCEDYYKKEPYCKVCFKALTDDIKQQRRNYKKWF